MPSASNTINNPDFVFVLGCGLIALGLIALAVLVFQTLTAASDAVAVAARASRERDRLRAKEFARAVRRDGVRAATVKVPAPRGSYEDHQPRITRPTFPGLTFSEQVEYIALCRVAPTQMTDGQIRRLADLIVSLNEGLEKRTITVDDFLLGSIAPHEPSYDEGLWL